MNNISDLIYTNMFNKLREKTGKQFVKKFKTPAGKLTKE
jgi:hypothetical protein